MMKPSSYCEGLVGCRCQCFGFLRPSLPGFIIEHVRKWMANPMTRKLKWHLSISKVAFLYQSSLCWGLLLMAADAEVFGRTAVVSGEHKQLSIYPDTETKKLHRAKMKLQNSKWKDDDHHLTVQRPSKLSVRMKKYWKGRKPNLCMRFPLIHLVVVDYARASRCVESNNHCIEYKSISLVSCVSFHHSVVSLIRWLYLSVSISFVLILFILKNSIRLRSYHRTLLTLIQIIVTLHRTLHDVCKYHAGVATNLLPSIFLIAHFRSMEIAQTFHAISRFDY